VLTLCEIIMEVNAVHDSNAFELIVVTPNGTVKLTRPEFLNELEPIVVILKGM
jgi:hypothetical protein